MFPVFFFGNFYISHMKLSRSQGEYAAWGPVCLPSWLGTLLYLMSSADFKIGVALSWFYRCETY